jgi:hypothetical protein
LLDNAGRSSGHGFFGSIRGAAGVDPFVAAAVRLPAVGRFTANRIEMV